MTLRDHKTSFNDREDQLAVIRRHSNIRSYGVIKGIMGSGVVDSLPLRVRCECGMLICEEIIEVKLSERRQIRRNYPRGFIVVPLHVDARQDAVVSTTSTFCVVEKSQFTESVTDL